ncbi:TraB/GumN family protein [Mucilaginibacter sp. HMF5004]|uniref:TraB/GumN family protein n=1 Tax=Mucilaginibacter rivuli TaxID=2857527 RepID=UPI001C6067D6|nr:TraB/GumN family protein [Mucilaginibacter rivuli]MBW4891912.1 TraB/GumN family protein [Mucilaginibacter rivuli]
MQVQSVLWKIQAPGSSKTSYILGSMHDFGKEWVGSYPKLDSVIKVSDVYLCENTSIANTGNTASAPASPIVTRLNAKAIFGKDYDKVNDYFIKNTGSGLTQNIDSDKDPVTVLNGMLLFLRNEWATGKGLKISFDGMDAALLANARSKKLPCISLDDAQITKGITSTPLHIKNSVAEIVDFVSELTNMSSPGHNEVHQDPYLKTQQLYNSGKFNFNFANDNDRGEKLERIKTRNTFWMKKIPGYLTNNRAFIVIGVAHLDGKSGLLMQLKKRGFKVTPIDLL